MAVVLGHGANAREARQGAAALVAVQAREFRVAHRQLAVRVLATVEELTVPRAVHGLEAELLALVPFHQEHVVAEQLVVSRGLEQLRAEDLRRDHLQVAVAGVERAHEFDEAVVERDPLGQIERRAR